MIAGPNTPTASNFYNVYGKELPTGVLGLTEVYDSAGNSTSVNSNWNSIKIYLTNVTDSFSAASNITNAAKKTFQHEVGHALKLRHPAVNSSYVGHTYSGYPKAIMNQGLPNGTYISYTITSHDKSNLRTKWGN